MNTFTGFVLWCILLILCWPLALVLIFLYPILWVLMLPFRLIGITVEGIFNIIKAIFMLPFRMLKSV